MRNTFADTFYELAKNDRRLVAVVADISPAGSIAKFRQEFPDRFINTGVAEQIMIGMAAGMAQRGLRPFAYTIAKFSLYRPFEFVRDDLCYQNLPVTVVGIGPGVTYSTLGGSHHAMEDIALATSIPNMTVIAPCDPEEVRAATRWCATESQGPVYLRLGKAGEPVLTKDAVEPFEVGRMRVVARGTGTCVIAAGPILGLGKAVAEQLAAEAGAPVTLVSAHTLKPFDTKKAAELLRSHQRVIAIEEHVPHGGLSSRLKEVAWDSGAKCELRCFTLEDAFHHVYGSHADILSAHGLDEARILAALGRPAQVPAG